MGRHLNTQAINGDDSEIYFPVLEYGDSETGDPN